MWVLLTHRGHALLLLQDNPASRTSPPRWPATPSAQEHRPSSSSGPVGAGQAGKAHSTWSCPRTVAPSTAPEEEGHPLLSGPLACDPYQAQEGLQSEPGSAPAGSGPLTVHTRSWKVCKGRGGGDSMPWPRAQGAGCLRALQGSAASPFPGWESSWSLVSPLRAPHLWLSGPKERLW